jgi:hypothetical protein
MKAYNDLVLPAMALRPSRAAAVELQAYLNTGGKTKALPSTSSRNLNSSFDYGSKALSSVTYSDTSSQY